MIPPWMSIYSTATTGCTQWIVATIKVKLSEAKYNGFNGLLRSMLSTSKCRTLGYVFMNGKN
jgi:hypothetical protein